MHRKAALGLTLLQILSKAIKPINAGIHVRNVGTQYSGIAVQLCKNIQSYVLIRDVYREICKKKREFDKNKKQGADAPFTGGQLPVVVILKYLQSACRYQQPDSVGPFQAAIQQFSASCLC